MSEDLTHSIETKVDEMFGSLEPVDDSGIFHGTYDPVKAHEYYLKNRTLKGRAAAGASATSLRPRAATPSKAVKAVGQKPNRSNTKSRRAELEAQKAALEKRLDHLRDVLKKLVEEAKKTSHKNAAKKPASKDEKGRAPETKADKADRNANEKSTKPLTAAQKHRKAAAAKKAYEKEHPNSLSNDVDVLREQVKDIQTKIRKALADAAERKKKANKQHAQPKKLLAGQSAGAAAPRR